MANQVDWNDIIQDGDNSLIGDIPAGNDPEFVTEPHLACCLLVDVSGSMANNGKINQLNNALAQFRDQVCHQFRCSRAYRRLTDSNGRRHSLCP